MEEKEHKHECCTHQTTNKKNYLLIGMVALILIIVVIQSFQINAMKAKFSSSNLASTSGKIDMSGWTENEKMMYEHHGTLPARLQGNAPQQSGGIVGGC